MPNDKHKKPLDLAAVREGLAGLQGKQYWRSLEELAETEEFQELLHREFPRQAQWLGPVNRRQFLKVMGASLALAGLTACGRTPPAKIVPYVEAPENIVPGKPLFFATAMPLGGFGTGVLVENHMGRPTKVEGNPQHPASLGATDPFMQGSILTMYDPDRSQAVFHRGRISTWEAFLEDLAGRLDGLRARDGEGLRLLTETVTSPTLAAQIEALLDAFPAARWHQYQPVSRDNIYEGALLAFGQPVNTLYRFDRADRILSLDADFMLTHPGHVRYAREWSNRRRVREGETDINRMYVVESMPTITGSVADHRLPLRSSQVEAFARAVAQQLGVEGVSGDLPAEVPAEWVAALVRDLQQHRGSSIILAGEEQPAVVHALVHAMNFELGNVGSTVVHTEPVEANPVNQTEELRELVEAMAAGRVDTLIIISGNPVFTAPVDFDFAEHLANVPFRVHMGLYRDETAVLCHWHIPETHYLESWSDVRAFDGTVSIIQPLIEPLYDGKSAHELLGAMLNEPNPSSYEIVRSFWAGPIPPGDFEQTWRRALHDGVIEGTDFPERDVSLQVDFAELAQPPAAEAEDLEIVFRRDPTIWDGRFANNAWMQELEKPMTHLTWDNAAFISIGTAERLGVTTEDVVELRFRDYSVAAPIWVVPGHANDSVTVNMGYGRTLAGRVGTELGFNAYAIRTSDAPWIGTGLEIVKTGQRYPLATTQNHYQLEGRDLIHAATIGEFEEHPDFVQGHGVEVPMLEHEGPAGTEDVVPEPPSLYPEFPYEGYAWGMAIDLNVCIGCEACNIACMAENNIPVVGKEGIILSREMYWIKVDLYYEGDLDYPSFYHQPRPCMHCEKAPCEPVCPVSATVHSSEGLNQMVYNRCVGTRYCSNNCPYKVRRFNFFDYTNDDIPVLKMWKNPDVTVRARGVMEKCTYCVQRINHARIEAEKENRQIRDGELFTACQQACPTQAIVFGDINDPTSQVRKLKEQPHNYGMLAEELGTQPRTTYLARFRNPNPEIETG